MQEIVRAYDTIASEYDRQVEGDAWMRHLLWRHYARLFRPGDRVLDVSCGTGIDALFLAQRGIHVTGIDCSPGMIAQLQDKVARHDLADLVTARVLDFADLHVFADHSFDGLISAFAGLNTTADLTPFAADAARLLRPGGHLVAHMLNCFSLWEWLWLLTQRQWAAAHRLGRQRERTFMIGHQPVRHYIRSPDATYRQFFAPYFDLRRAYGVGILRPPHGLTRIPPPLVGMLRRMEQGISSHRPFRNWGRFFVLDLVRREP